MCAIPESSAPDTLRAFEHERWQSAARVYHDEFGRLTSQVAEPLLDAAGVAPGGWQSPEKTAAFVIMLEAIRAEVTERCRPWLRDGGLVLPMSVYVACGRKP